MTDADTTPLLRATTILATVLPPWLQRTVGGRFMLGIADVVDAQIDRAREAVAARFPRDASAADALARIGAERRIRRGPGEDATTYARRLRTWLDAHRRRGSSYTLLEQLFYFLRYSLAPRMDVVAQSGNRYYIPAGAAGIDEIVHDAITWGGDGSGPAAWAHLWVFYYVTDIVETVVTEADEEVVDEGGDLIIATLPFSGGLSSDDEELFRAIPREWRAGHVPYVTCVLLYTDPTGAPARLWNYPQPITDTWATHAPRTWAGPIPVVLIAE